MKTRQLNEQATEALSNLAKNSLYFKSTTTVRGSSGKSTMKSLNTLRSPAELAG